MERKYVLTFDSVVPSNFLSTYIAFFKQIISG